MKIQELKQVIKKIAMQEMARIASGFKLTSDWNEKWSVDPGKNSLKFQKILNYLKEKDEVPTTLKELAIELYNSNDTATVNQSIAYLKKQGVVQDVGYMSEPKSATTVRKNEPGVYGRPKITDDSAKMLGINIVRKFSQGNTNFSEEEKDLIKKIYNSIS
jgi:hypothetical protein